MPAPLPILEKRDEIAAAIAGRQVVVVCGETGSGKTTQLPQICLDMGLAKHAMIGHTQPRRLAARAVAARIAEERGEPAGIGGLVGAKIRFHDHTTRRTKIKVMTDGVLLAELASDPEVRAYSTIIIDEAHERSLNIDFLLGYLKCLLPRRADLKIIITSATIDPGRFAAFFGRANEVPVIEVSGRMYPVEVRYRPVGDDEEEFERIEVEAVADAVNELTSPRLPEGGVLVFVPGEREIRQCAEAVRRRGGAVEVLPLYSRLTNQEQDRIFHPPPPGSGTRRVIISTNVAETSLTVPGIRYVIDTGFARQSRYDPAKKIQRLPIEPISQASAQQRSGRCGRVSAGVCIRLYSEASFRARPAHTEPEVLRTNLAGAILRMKALDLGPIEQFPFLDPPEAEAVRDGYETLFELGAIDRPSAEGALTPTGDAMSRVPADPRIARILLAAEREGALRECIVLAAALSIQDPRDRPMSRQQEADRAHLVFRDEAGDFLTLLKIWDHYSHAAEESSPAGLRDWCREQFLSAARMREWVEMTRQLRDIADELELRRNDHPAAADRIHRALLTGLITNAACREGPAGTFDYRGVRGNVVNIFPGSVLFRKSPKWIVAAEVVQTTRLYARTIARVEPEWIEELAGHMFQRQLSDKHLDPETGEPSAWERVTMSGIVVVPRRQTPIARLDPNAARPLFIGEALARAKWKTDEPFMAHNRSVLNAARQAEAKLRRRGVIVADDLLDAWFEARVPAGVRDPVAFLSWLRDAEQRDANTLRLSLDDVLTDDARAALATGAFPDELELGEDSTEHDESQQATPPQPSPGRLVLSYAFAPGKDEDGITATAFVGDLPKLTDERAAWLVPGMLPELVAALIRILPKAVRATIEAKGTTDATARTCAELLAFARGPLPAALSEAVSVALGVDVPAEMWALRALPTHLRLRVRVVDEHADELAAGRDLAALKERFAGRIKKSRAAAARSAFDRRGITTWDFGELPESVEADSDAAMRALHPAIVDQGRSVSISLLESAQEAARETPFGVRRLFAITAAEEVSHYLDALPQWREMVRHFGPFGSEDSLRDALTCIIAERVFMSGHAAVRTQTEFEARSRDCWGRLSAAAREVGDVVARTLEPRARVAQRLSGGTPRLWAESIADLREHAAYLMPHDFLRYVPWDRLKRYPMYAHAMRERLFALREDGKGAETDALRTFLPHWKKFTAWVARAMAAERASREEADDPAAAKGKAPHAKAPLPQARRAAPAVNLDAGEWAIRPGNLPAPIERYRWALEELRVALFAPKHADTHAASVKEIERLWSKST